MKKRIIPIILTVFAVFLIILMNVIIKENSKASNKGKITISLYTSDLMLIEKKTIAFNEDDTFFKLLNSNYNIEMDGSLLIRINDLYAKDIEDEFIKIYVNCKASSYGVKMMKLNDGDNIVFVIEKTRSGNFDNEFC